MFNLVSLASSYETVRDAAGITKKAPVWRKDIPATFVDVTRSEELYANQIGYRADLVVEMMACNYCNEDELMDQATETRYKIRRAYGKRGRFKVQLTCEVIDNGD